MIPLLLVAGQALDVFSFLVAVSLVPALLGAETNPFLVGLYTAAGMVGVVALKLGLPLLAAYAYGLRRRGKLAKLMVGLAALSGFVGMASNVYALAMVMK